MLTAQDSCARGVLGAMGAELELLVVLNCFLIFCGPWQFPLLRNFFLHHPDLCEILKDKTACWEATGRTCVVPRSEPSSGNGAFLLSALTAQVPCSQTPNATAQQRWGGTEASQHWVVPPALLSLLAEGSVPTGDPVMRTPCALNFRPGS